MHYYISGPPVPGGGSQALRLEGPKAPIVVRNDSEASVVLDCDYRYDLFEAPGLTVKWFWERDHEPVYQWIPGGVPEVRGILKVGAVVR